MNRASLVRESERRTVRSDDFRGARPNQSLSGFLRPRRNLPPGIQLSCQLQISPGDYNRVTILRMSHGIREWDRKSAGIDSGVDPTQIIRRKALAGSRLDHNIRAEPTEFFPQF